MYHLEISTTDFIIVLLYILAVVVFGMWIGRGQKDLSDYLLGGRDLPWWAILGSIVATETSTATFLSLPGLAFAAGGDLRFLQLALGLIIGRYIVSIVLLPQYFRGNLFTAYEVLDKRFGGVTKQTASVLFLITRNLGDGLRLFLTAIVMEKVVGADLATCIVLIGIATIIYTFFGGMKAVVWNDCIQFVVYIAGGIAAGLVIINLLPGGWQELATFAQTEEKLRLFDFSFNFTATYTFWSGIIGGAALSLGTHGTDQMMVQRYLSSRSEADARRAVVLSGIVVFVQFTLFLLLGIALACFYSHLSPDTKFESNDQVLATFIVQHLPVGLVGITLAAVFSAAMSTLSSSLNSSASAAVNDLYCPALKQEPSSKHLLNASRVFTVFFGIVQIVVGIAASYVSKNVITDALAIAGFSAGILLGIFALGVYSKRANQAGAMWGMIAGAACLAAVKFLTAIAWTWYAIMGAIVTFTVGWIISALLPKDKISENNQGDKDAN